MVKLGSFELVAGTDVKAGEKTSIPSLFPISERSKEYQLLEDAKEGTRLKVSIAKVHPFESSADATLKKGDRATSWRLIKYADFVGDVVASEDIKAGEKLVVNYDTKE
jgi:hypothetical protein